MFASIHPGGLTDVWLPAQVRQERGLQESSLAQVLLRPHGPRAGPGAALGLGRAGRRLVFWPRFVHICMYFHICCYSFAIFLLYFCHDPAIHWPPRLMNGYQDLERWSDFRPVDGATGAIGAT